MQQERFTLLDSKWVYVKNELINLNALSRITFGTLPEEEDGNTGPAFYISFTPIVDLLKREEGTDGSYVLAIYNEDERDLFHEDCERIKALLADK